jgi:GntR family transcriptional regulator/MocR family aminotransferase
MSGGPEILLHLDRSHPETLAGQLRSGLRDAIRAGRLPAGTRLPASRVLAEDLEVSRGVVVDAYAQLVAEGFLVTRPGSATVVSDVVAIDHPPRPHSHSAPQRLWRPELDLRPAGPDVTMFPRSQAARTMTDLFRHLPAAEFSYTGPWGVTRLREQLAAHLSRVRAAMAPADGIIVVTGGTQALAVTVRTLAAAGHQRMAVEDPGDPTHRRLVQAHGLEPVPVPVDAEGLAVDVLRKTGCRAVLTTPGYHFPTGTVMSAARRAGLLQWAAECSGYIVEDDRRADFHFGRSALACLQGMRPAHVIMIGSVSLTLAPGMRLGWVVPPPGLLRAIAEAKRDDDFGTGVIEQHALASWIESGHYDRHVRHLRRVYGTRRAELSRQLSRHLPGWPQHGAAAGLEILLELPAGISEAHVVAHARQLGLGISALGPMRITSTGSPALVLSSARLAARHCDAAAARLRLAVTAVLAEEQSLTAATVLAETYEPWRLTSADWPATTEDFYGL